MSTVKTSVANCPTCGAPVEFKISSALVTVCPSCQSVVARGDRALEDHGKVAALVDTNSPLELGLQGTYDGKPFELVGHVQYQHEAGGVWNEWYAALPGDKWAWLSESQGKFHLTFPRQIEDGAQFPSWQEIHAGNKYKFPGIGELTVAEAGRARAAGAEGELPYDFTPGAIHNFADLAGPEGAYATVDFGEDPPVVFLGQETSLKELGITARGDYDPEFTDERIASGQVSCPNCGGSLELKAPDVTERVGCPYCSSLLDCDNGKLAYLKTLDQGQASIVVPLGSVGTINGVEYTVIGFMRRSVTYDMDYFWSEYLLYSRDAGFAWLIHNEGHWSFGESVSPGEVSSNTSRLTGGNFINHGMRSYRLFQQAAATVRYVVGEFFWKVEVGEAVYARDFISPPYMMSLEMGGRQSEDDTGKDTSEVNVTRSTFMTHEEVAKAFGVKGLSAGWGVAPNQPAPVNHHVFLWWALGGGLLVALYFLFEAGIAPQVELGILIWALFLVSVIPIGAAIYRFSFEKRRWAESDFSPYSSE